MKFQKQQEVLRVLYDYYQWKLSIIPLFSDLLTKIKKKFIIL